MPFFFLHVQKGFMMAYSGVIEEELLPQTSHLVARIHLVSNLHLLIKRQMRPFALILTLSEVRPFFDVYILLKKNLLTADAFLEHSAS